MKVLFLGMLLNRLEYLRNLFLRCLERVKK